MVYSTEIMGIFASGQFRSRSVWQRSSLHPVRPVIPMLGEPVLGKRIIGEPAR